MSFKFKMKLHWGSEDPDHRCDCVAGNALGVHQHTGGLWWFTDEIQVDEFGGFCTKEEAEQSMRNYAEQL